MVKEPTPATRLWGESVMRSLTAHVANLGADADRATALSAASFTCGRLVGGRLVDEETVTAALYDAGRACGLSTEATHSAINGGNDDHIFALSCLADDGVHIVIEKCPICSERHRHGADGALPTDIHFGFRVPHCTGAPQSYASYLLVNAKYGNAKYEPVATRDTGAAPMQSYMKLFRDNDHFGLETNIQDEAEFWRHLAEALAGIVPKYEADLEFNLQGWLPHAFEIVAKIRGYKADVTEYRVLTAGHGGWNNAPDFDSSLRRSRPPLAAVE